LNNKEFFKDEFIGQWLSDELPSEKEINFQKWLKVNPEEVDYFKRKKKLWQNFQKIQLEAGFSQKERWDAITNKLNIQNENIRNSQNKYFIWKIASVAAVLFFFITVSYFWIEQQNIVEITSLPGSRQTTVLPDGSQINLNAQSSIKYNKKSWDKNREVILLGEAFFDVTPGRPFIVKSHFITTKVLGTSFNIKTRNNRIEVSCITGKVSVQSRKKEQTPIILSPGFISIIENDGILKQPQILAINERIGWISQKYYFSSTPLREVLDEVERQYGVNIILKKKIGDQLFTGMFEGADVKKALAVICLSNGLQYTLSEKKITIF
jgi:transmembrane sensor